MKRLLIALFVLSLGFTAQASHYLGGEITWRCADSGPNAGKFKFYVVLYRECGTGASTYMPNPVVLSTNAPVGSISCAQVGASLDVSPDCYTATGEISCGGVVSGKGAVEERRFESAWITIAGVPPATGWYYTFTDCCRPSITNLTGSSSYTLRAFMFPYTIAGVPQNASTCYDNSPRFLEPPKTVICSGYEYTYAHNAFDNDLDSIVYDWAYPVTTNYTTNATFSSPYSYNNPLPNGGNTVGFNNETGSITFTPSAAGSFATCVKVTSYRCNQRIAEVYRDIPVVIRTDCGFNSPPTVQINNIPNFPQLVPVVLAGDTLYWETTVFAGEIIKFDIVAQDPQLLPNFLPQTIEFAPSGGQLGVPLNNPLAGCLNPPCATVSPKSPQTTYTNTLNNEVSFYWETNCDHISYQTNACGLPTNKYVFALRMQDNFCPAPAISVASVVINVVSTIPIPPDMSNSCVSVQADGSIDISWVPPIDTGMNYDSYVVFHGINATAPFTAIDTIANYSATTYNHATPNPGGSNYYYIRTIGGCSYTSITSDTIRSIGLTVTPIPPTASSVALLNWNHGNSSASTYEVWRRPLTGAWSNLGNTTDTTYRDTVNVCGESLEYQIRIAGACESTIDGGFFSDMNNSDVIVIDSLTVVGGTATISWQAATNTDIIEYELLKYDVATTAWQSIATVPVGTLMPYPIPGVTPNTMVDRYKVISTDSCGNQSSDLLVSAHNNILLTENSDPCDGELRMRWNGYRGWTGGVKEYRIMADVTPPGGTTQFGVLFNTNNGSDTTYRTKNIIAGWDYCFYIRAIDTSSSLSSRSNDKCFNGLSLQRSRLMYLAKAHVRSDNSIETVVFIDRDADVIHYDIQRADNFTSSFTSLGLIPKPVMAPWEIRFIDVTADPNNYRYRYRVVATDSCGGIDTASNIGTNVLLEVEGNDNLTNVLKWNHYLDYMGVVGSYEIYRSEGPFGGFTYLTSTSDTIFTDNVRPMGDNSGFFCYKVVALEANNPLAFRDADGTEFRSASNKACAEHEPRVFIPTSFNPISNVVENRTWKPSHSYVAVKKYQLDIFDRWGNMVFSTKDENQGWDGTVNGDFVPTGAYVYHLTFNSVQGVLIEKKGSITLYFRKK
ncbi:MAG: gliding motility-associated C-terminal domain-containing protein [Schleiferiaceae bacterium]|nr:gliding motility-associated C-terminal domain-containing protein [Schleiferiaceae bacterium]